MMVTTDLSYLDQAATKQSSRLHLRNGKVVRQTVFIPGAGPTADDGVSTDKGETNATVGIHRVTCLTQQTELSLKRRKKGLSEDPSASQRKADLWKGKEEEELKHLVSTHTGPKEIISWVKVSEAWNTLDLPERSKSSLSSK
jgi:hypothetical protein